MSKSTTSLATEVWSQRPSRGEKLRCNFLARKSAKLFANTSKGGNFWQGLVQNSSLISAFWQGKVQNSSPMSALLTWRHFRLTLSLSLSLSLSPSAPHAQYRKRFRASYNTCQDPDAHIHALYTYVRMHRHWRTHTGTSTVAKHMNPRTYVRARHTHTHTHTTHTHKIWSACIQREFIIPIPLTQHQHNFCQRRRFDQDCSGLRQVEMNNIKSAWPTCTLLLTGVCRTIVYN